MADSGFLESAEAGSHSIRPMQIKFKGSCDAHCPCRSPRGVKKHCGESPLVATMSWVLWMTYLSFFFFFFFFTVIAVLFLFFFY